MYTLNQEFCRNNSLFIFNFTYTVFVNKRRIVCGGIPGVRYSTTQKYVSLMINIWNYTYYSIMFPLIVIATLKELSCFISLNYKNKPSCFNFERLISTVIGSVVRTL